MERDGTMNLVTGIWAGIKELIKGEFHYPIMEFSVGEIDDGCNSTDNIG